MRLGGYEVMGLGGYGVIKYDCIALYDNSSTRVHKN